MLEFYIAACLLRQGDYQKSFELLKTVENYQLRFQEQGINLRLLRTQYYIADCLKRQGNYKDAVELFKTVENQYSICYEEEHPYILTTQYSIASCLIDLGDYQNALQLLRTVEK